MHDEAGEDQTGVSQQIENSHRIRVMPSWLVNVVTKRAKSTSLCWPAGVSKRTSNGFRLVVGRIAAVNRFTAVKRRNTRLRGSRASAGRH